MTAGSGTPSARRPDGRAFDQIRAISIEVGLLPRTHGSALFTRGETQALVTATLGTKEDAQRIEMLDIAKMIEMGILQPVQEQGGGELQDPPPPPPCERILRACDAQAWP